MNNELNKKFYLSFFENIHDAIIIVKDGFFVDCNPKSLEVFNCEKEHLLGRNIHDFSPSYQTDGMLSTTKAKELIKKSIDGIPQNFEWKHSRFDGSHFDAEITLLKIDCDNDFFILSIVKDISERKKAEQELKEREEQYRRLIESINEAIISINNKGLIISWNSLAEKIFGYNHSEVIGKSITLLLPEKYIELRKILFEQIELGLNDVFRRTFELFGLHKSENEVPLELSFSKVVTENNYIITIIVRDITMRKQKERAILHLNSFLEKRAKNRTVELDILNEQLKAEIKKEKQIEIRLQILLSSITDYTYHVTIENNIAIKTTHGEGCFAVTGYKVEEFIEDTMLWYKIIYSDDQKIVNVQIRRLMKNKIANSIEHRIIHKDGNIRWIKNTYVPLLDDETLIGYDGLISDITNTKLLEQQVLNAVIETEEKERLHFSQDLHDSLGPTLAASKALIQLMNKPNITFNRDEILLDIENLLNESIQNVRDISFRLSPHILKNYGLFEAIESFINKVRESSNINFDITLDSRHRFNEKIETVVYRILCECINNTIKHSKATKVTLTIFCIKKNLFVEYIDNGIGFNVASKLADHKGVGLMNMQSRVKSINGSINIQSSKEKGTSIKLQIKTGNS